MTLLSTFAAGGLLQARPLQINDDFVDRGANSISDFFSGMPSWLGTTLAVLVILAIFFIIALVLRALITKGINATPLGRRAQTTGGNIGKALGKAAFWLTLLYGGIVALSQVDGSERYLGDAGSMFSDFGSVAFRVLIAGFVMFIGYILAKVADNATTATADAVGVDNFMNSTGVTSATGATGSLSNALGTIVFVVVFAFAAIWALDILDIETITEPIQGLLESFLDFIPRIIGAAVILGAAIFIGRFVSNFLQTVLPTLGFDRSVNELMMLDDGKAMSMSPSRIFGTVAFIIIAVLGLTAAIGVLEIPSLSNAFEEILAFGAGFLRAAVLLVVGVFLANFLERIVSGATGSSVGRYLKYAIIFLVGFIALSQIDGDSDIVAALFQAIVIAGAVAASIAFGVGGVNWAKDVLNNAAPPKQLGSSIQSSTSRTASAVKTAAARVKAAPTKATTKPQTRTAKARTTKPRTPKT